ncbi:hypothetical protein HNQ99_002988 [Rhizorhapis suberifaciens]|uniref:Uncharacterized protein n=1 Tax=Rhizorhapis suberifaciens TaxID=13656 RepID=A0A840HWE9_9SPHN|nr:hypothetical protein [Rhizorhapis suberifaciens]
MRYRLARSGGRQRHLRFAATREKLINPKTMLSVPILQRVVRIFLKTLVVWADLGLDPHGLLREHHVDE